MQSDDNIERETSTTTDGRTGAPVGDEARVDWDEALRLLIESENRKAHSGARAIDRALAALPLGCIVVRDLPVPNCRDTAIVVVALSGVFVVESTDGPPQRAQRDAVARNAARLSKAVGVPVIGVLCSTATHVARPPQRIGSVVLCDASSLNSTISSANAMLSAAEIDSIGAASLALLSEPQVAEQSRETRSSRRGRRKKR